MGNVLRDGRNCREEIRTNRRNQMLREFQSNRRAVNFQQSSDYKASERLFPSFGEVSQITKSKEMVRKPQLSKIQNLACPISNQSESSSCRVMQKSMRGKFWEQQHSSSANQFLALLAPSSVSESSKYDNSCSTPYSVDEEMYFCDIERPSSAEYQGNRSPLYACSPRKVGKQVKDEERVVPTIDGIGHNGETRTAKAFSSPERKRRKAIDLIPVERPGGKFVQEKEFFLQSGKGTWENVKIEN